MSLIDSFSEHTPAWVFGTIAALILGGVAVPDLAKSLNRRYFEVRVTNKDIKGKEGKYLIWANSIPPGEPRVFENTDNWFAGKVNSSDKYGEIEIGKTYRIQTAGWRWQFASSYENILRLEEMPEAEFVADSVAMWRRHF